MTHTPGALASFTASIPSALSVKPKLVTARSPQAGCELRLPWFFAGQVDQWGYFAGTTGVITGEERSTTGIAPSSVVR